MSAPSLIDPHQAPSTSLAFAFRSALKNRLVIQRMIDREVVGRYRGSVFGLAWSLLTPILMLLVYSFVFSQIFKSKWVAGSEPDSVHFVIILFVGLIVYGFFSEVINKAPSLIIANPNYVKKVVFSIEIFPFILVGSALFNVVISTTVLLLAFVLSNYFLHWTVVLFPLVLLPFVIGCLGLAWILSSLGVFLRDIGQTIGVLTAVLMFLSPVFYPISAVPEKFRFFIHVNPLTFVIEQSRLVLLWGKQPNWLGLFVYSIAALLIAWAGFAWFQKTRKGFADVL